MTDGTLRLSNRNVPFVSLIGLSFSRLPASLKIKAQRTAANFIHIFKFLDTGPQIRLLILVYIHAYTNPGESCRIQPTESNRIQPTKSSGIGFRRILSDSAESCRIQRNPIGSSRIQWDPAESCRIQWNPIGSSRIQWDLGESNGIQANPIGCS